MAEPQPHYWGFDRNPWDLRAEANTFSVGVYQWLPKASGKGLKKSNTIRVLGYVADSQAVYDKAKELCKRLNAEKVRWGEFPDWVQKSYSVSKPAGLVMKRQSPGLSGDQARVIRNRAVKEHLLPHDFIQSHASTYVRRVRELVQVLHFQTNPVGGGSCRANPAFHYIFTPLRSNLRRRRWTEMEELDCSLRPRNALGPWEEIHYWLDFGDDPERLRGNFIHIIQKTLRAFDEFTTALKDPARLLTREPGRKLLAPFLVSFPVIFFTSIEMRLGRLDDAEKRLKEPGPDAYLERVYRPRHRRLLKLIEQLRHANGDPPRLSKQTEWVTE